MKVKYWAPLALVALAALGWTLAPGSHRAPAAPRTAAPAARHPWLVLGIDGADWGVIRTLWERGELPNLERLAERGTSAVLRTDYGESPVIWTTIATGVNPERHGITGFVIATERGDVPIASTLRKVPALWNMLTLARRRVAVAGWWASWPAEAVNGVVVTDRAPFDAPQRIYPETALPRLEQALAAAARRPWAGIEDPLGELRDKVTAEMALDLVDDGYDLLLVYLRSPDLASHTHWKYWQPDKFPSVDPAELAAKRGTIPAAYTAVDGVLGELLAAGPPDLNVLVISDHGFLAKDVEEVRVQWNGDRLLEQLGLLTFGADGEVDLGRSRLHTFRSPPHHVRKRLRFALEAGDRAVPATTRAAIRAELEARLAGVRFANGEHAFALVEPDPQEAGEADLILAIRPEVATRELQLDGAPLRRVIVSLDRVSGTHFRDTHGILIAAGPDVERDARLAAIRVHDIAPTLLYALGLPVADDFAGRARRALFTTALRARQPLRRIATWGAQRATSVPEAAAGDRELVDELRALGYLD